MWRTGSPTGGATAPNDLSTRDRGGLRERLRRLLGVCAGAARTRAELARLRDFLSAAADFLWETDRELRLVYLSPEASRVLGRPATELLGCRLFELVSVPRALAGDAGTLLLGSASAPRFVPGRPFRDLRCSYVDPAGRSRILEASAVPVRDRLGRFRGYRGTAREVSERVRLEGRLRFLAGHDPLTGVANRALLEAAARSTLSRRLARRGRAGVLLLDVDRFKQINDGAGHAAGDAVLRALARRLEEAARATDLVARIGGDEFVVLLGELAGREELLARERAIERRLGEPISWAERTLRVGVSIGAALAPEDGEDLATLLARADAEMYRRKRGRRGLGAHPDARLVEVP